jgi:hypothetical protein
MPESTELRLYGKGPLASRPETYDLPDGPPTPNAKEIDIAPSSHDTKKL